MNNGYKGYTDEELIVMLRDGDTAVTDFIMEKYKNLVRSKAKSMFIIGGDEDDLIQEGMIGLFKAIRDYDSGRDASFFTFATSGIVSITDSFTSTTSFSPNETLKPAFCNAFFSFA